MEAPPLSLFVQPLAAVLNPASSERAGHQERRTKPQRPWLNKTPPLSHQPTEGCVLPSARRAPAVRRGARSSDALLASAPDRRPSHLQWDIAPAVRAPGCVRRSSPNPDPRPAQVSAVSALTLRWLAELRPARVRRETADAQ